jgi:hypothetical protein
MSGTDPAGAFIEPFLWNVFESYFAYGQMFACNALGFWGELLYNDNGEMMDKCYRGFKGDNVKYEMLLTDTASSL